MTGKVCMLLAAVLLVVLCGCDSGRTEKPVVRETFELPASLRGTVLEWAYLEGGDNLVVRGYGLVSGLAGNGSSEAPPAVRAMLTDQINKMTTSDTGAIIQLPSPNRIIGDLDTAIVEITGVIPAGAPSGTRVDLTVRALPQTSTRSLDGGNLMSAELRQFVTSSRGTVGGDVLAMGQGSVFVNPFAAPEDPDTAMQLREGLVFGGATIKEGRPLRLLLYKLDYRQASLVEDLVNQRFNQRPEVANAVGPGRIDLTVPRAYRNDYGHFLDIVRHLMILQTAGDRERKLRSLTQVILAPDAPFEDISLIWEAGGMESLGIIRPLYNSENPTAAYFASRAGARLDDEQAIASLVRIARDETSPMRLDAIVELGRCHTVEAMDTLTRMLNEPNDVVRFHAYEALLRMPKAGYVRRIDVDGRFELDVVPTKGEFAVYASRQDKPRIAIFGEGMSVMGEVFFNAPDDLVTIHARRGDSTLKIYRCVGRQKITSDQLEIPFGVEDLVVTMGRKPKLTSLDEIRGLGLTYSQVVGVLYRMCEKQCIPARFVLQRSPETRRIYQTPTAVGRPATADE